MWKIVLYSGIAPDSVACAAVAPPTLDLRKPRHDLLLPCQTTARRVVETDVRFWVDREVEEQLHDLSIEQDSRLGRAARKLVHSHDGEADELQGAIKHSALVVRRAGHVLAHALCLSPATRRFEELTLTNPERVAFQHDTQRVQIDVREPLRLLMNLQNHLLEDCKQITFVQSHYEMFFAIHQHKPFQ